MGTLGCLGCLGEFRPKHWILTKISICPLPVWVVGGGTCLGWEVFRWVGWWRVEGLSYRVGDACSRLSHICSS